MSNKQPIEISPRLQRLIERANFSFPSTGEAVMAAYKQALGEGYTPRQAKNVLYDNIHFLDKKTIRRYMPIEAKDTEKIRNLNRTADNDSQNVKQDNTASSMYTDQNSKILRRQNNLENIKPNSADRSAITKKDNYSNSTETILQLQNFIKQINECAAKLSDGITELDNKNQYQKEEAKQNREEKIVSGKTHLDIIVTQVYRDILHLKLNNITYGRILINNGSYINIEPRP
jgi:hypothetical protein